MKKASSKQARSYAKRIDTAKALAKFLEGDRFEIEKKPPPPVSRQQSQEHLKFREKVRVTAIATNVGMAMIVPSVGAKIAREFLNKEFPNYKFTINTILGNDDQKRIYKLNHSKNGTK